MKDDSKAFIFTLKNAHGVEPTRFMKREENGYAIECDSYKGPCFGNNNILINDKCNKEKSCVVYSEDSNGYECHTKYNISLFVNTAEVNEVNYFSVVDYEVFGINNNN